MTIKGKTYSSLLISIILHAIGFLIMMNIVIVHPEYQEILGIEFDFIKVYRKPPEERELPKLEPPEKNVPESQYSSAPKIASSTFSISLTPAGGGRRSSVMADYESRPTDGMTKTNFTSIGISRSEIGAAGIATRAQIRDNYEVKLSATIGQSNYNFTTTDGLSDASPSVEGDGTLRPKVPKGQGWLNTHYSGENLYDTEGISNGRFRGLMNDIAIGISASSNIRIIDIVFLLDATGSMVDNVRGIRAYIDTFLERLRRNKFDVALGLVAFSDGRTRPKTLGVTTDFGKFKNWMHQIDFTGGGDLTEAGLEAVMVAINEIDYRRRAQKVFIMVSDGPFHDADYDGRSLFSLDQVIAKLKSNNVQVEVVGLDYLPVKQLAWATGGQWRLIPGQGYLENISMPQPNKIYSQLGILESDSNSLKDEITVPIVRNPPAWVKLSWKVLNPHGEKFLGEFVDKRKIPLDNPPDKIRFPLDIDLSKVRGLPGTYTFIYRLEDSSGKRSILRRSVDLTW
ncbi:VWA domain-containing protein [bacterium]|nr:VWA domain-containing protein [bacterium]